MKGGESAEGESDSQTTLSFGCSVPMSAAKTDSPLIRALPLFICARVCACVYDYKIR